MNGRNTAYTIRGMFALAISAFLFLCAGCKEPPTWDDPVRDYFDYYTNSAEIEWYELSCEFLQDKNGDVCIASDANKTLSFYMRNPRKYNLNVDFNNGDASSGIITTQNQDDKTVINLTYPPSYLVAHDGGGEIGGTISIVVNDETLREFESYTFSLKCNTSPPSVKGHCVQVSGGKYVVCFYLPTYLLSSSAHVHDTHTLYINGNEIASGTASELASASSVLSSALNPLGGGTAFSSSAPTDYTAFYYLTDIIVSDDDDLSWTIYIEDDDGLSSKKMTASTRTASVGVTISGDGVLKAADSESTTLTASFESDEAIALGTCTWTSSDTDVAVVSGNGTTATVTAVSGGVATITMQAELSDGRIVTQSKEMRVLSLALSGDAALNLLKGQTATSLTVNKFGFPSTPSYSWLSSNSSVASVSSSGGVTPLAIGTTTITVSASYGGKTVSATKTVHVHEVSISGNTEVLAGQALSLSATISSPSGVSAPSDISYSWTSGSTAVATISGGSSTGTVTGVTSGTATITLTASYGGKNTTATKTVHVHEVSISGDSELFIEQTLSLSAVISSPSGVSTPSGISYSWTSGTTAVATISGSSSTASVTGVTNGTSTITLTVTFNSSSISVTKTINVYKLNLSGVSLIDKAGSAKRFTASVTGYDGTPTYSWSSSPTGKVSLSGSGATRSVSPIATGTTTVSVTATINGKTCTKSLSVTVYELTISGTTLVKKGASATTLTAAIGGYEGSVSWSWSSGTSSVASLSYTGQTATVSPGSAGSSRITVTATFGGTTATASKNFYVCDVSITSSATTIFTGKGLRLLKTCTGFPSTPTYTWTSSNTSVLSVNTDGDIIGVNKGSATVTLKASYDGVEVSTTKTICVIGFVFDNSSFNSNIITLRKGDVYTGTMSFDPARPANGFGFNFDPTIVGIGYNVDDEYTITAVGVGTVVVKITVWDENMDTTTMDFFTITVIE